MQKIFNIIFFIAIIALWIGVGAALSYVGCPDLIAMAWPYILIALYVVASIIIDKMGGIINIIAIIAFLMLWIGVGSILPTGFLISITWTCIAFVLLLLATIIIDKFNKLRRQHDR